MKSAMHAYPPELVAHVIDRWPPGVTPPRVSVLEKVLSVAYHASFLRDEERPVTFRLMLLEPGQIADDDGPPRGMHRMRFSSPRPFDEHELRRLALAVKYHRALIGLEERMGAIVVWGFIQSGPRWLQASRGGRAASAPLPPCLVVRVTRPGQVAVACGSEAIAELRNGRLIDLALDVFDSNWLKNRFASARDALVNEHAPGAGAEERTIDLVVVRALAQQVVKRTISTMREAHHGGVLVVLPPECAATLDTDQILTMKYGFAEEPPRRRFAALALSIFRELERFSGSQGPVHGNLQQYRDSRSADLGELDESLFEFSAMLAALADVDGVVVMTKRFEVLGFGAEIGGHLPQVHTVARALDLEGTEREFERVDGVGTRHRSTYRLCAHFKEAIGIVVSQDGSVRFVAWHDGAVTYWDHGVSE